MKQFVWILLLVSCSACGLNVQSNYQRVRPKLLKHDYDAAAAFLDSIKESAYSRDNRLLYHLDKGMVLHLAKRYRESNAELERAKVAAQELWTESIGKHALAWATTDNSLPYQGEDFERVLIHFVAALNHLGTKDYGSARVEARQVTNALELYNSAYATDKNVYRDDAFSRWLAGRLAETDDDLQALNDAWIDYRRAIDVYEGDYAQRYGTPLPRRVVRDALRVTQELGPDFAAEHAALRARYPDVLVPPPVTNTLGRVVLLHLNGEAPYKVDRFWTAMAGTDVVRVAYPEFKAKPHHIVEARIRVLETGEEATSEKMEDIGAIAVQNLRDHMGRIQTKAIARTVAKVVAGKAVYAAGASRADSTGGLMRAAAVVWNQASAFAEEADKRSWITLPAEVGAAEVEVPAGPVTLEVSFVGRDGRVIERTRLAAEVEAGRTTFLTYRTFK